MKEAVLAYWLSCIPGIGTAKITSLLAYYGSLPEIFSCSESTLQQVKQLRKKDCQALLKDRNYEKWEASYESLAVRGIRFIYRGEAEYPDRLKEIPDAPFALYVKGELPEAKRPSVAVVGARNATYEGRQLAERFGRELAENGVQVVSGLARGIDVSAQRGAMQILAGKTYGVLGTGIDICYPAQNIEIYMQMQNRGGVISEYPPGMRGNVWNFPMRNRIISGLSDGILIIEAKEGSGSLITAEAGLDQGREIFVLPGNVTSPAYAGGNQLIQSGACLVTCVRDILDGLGIFLDEDVSRKKKKIEVVLETAEEIVYAILSLDPIHVSEIVERTGLSVQDVMDSLLSLERKKLVCTVGNNFYAIRL